METITQLLGICQTRNPEQSRNELHWKDGEGHEGTFWPDIIPYLWGRDIMSRMGVYLYSPSTAVTNQMFQQVLVPNQDLGKNNEEKIDSIIPDGGTPRVGLGYF